MPEPKKLMLNLKDNPAEVTWKPYKDCLVVKIINKDVDLTLQLGQKEIRHMKQALAWS